MYDINFLSKLLYDRQKYKRYESLECNIAPLTYTIERNNNRIGIRKIRCK